MVRDSIEVQTGEAAPKVAIFYVSSQGRWSHDHAQLCKPTQRLVRANQNLVPTGSSHCTIVVGKVQGRRWFLQMIGGNEGTAEAELAV